MQQAHAAQRKTRSFLQQHRLHVSSDSAGSLWIECYFHPNHGQNGTLHQNTIKVITAFVVVAASAIVAGVGVGVGGVGVGVVGVIVVGDHDLVWKANSVTTLPPVVVLIWYTCAFGCLGKQRRSHNVH
eukprot:6471928-Amphidinium_carterae.1